MYYKVEVAKRKTKCVGYDAIGYSSDCKGYINKGEVRLRVAETNYKPYYRYMCFKCGWIELGNMAESITKLKDDLLIVGGKIRK